MVCQRVLGETERAPCTDQNGQLAKKLFRKLELKFRQIKSIVSYLNKKLIITYCKQGNR